MSDKVAVLQKPQLRGLLRTHMKKHLAISFVLAGAFGYAYKVLVNDVRKRKYAEYYRTYDAEAEFQRISKLGYFQSVSN